MVQNGEEKKEWFAYTCLRSGSALGGFCAPVGGDIKLNLTLTKFDANIESCQD